MSDGGQSPSVPGQQVVRSDDLFRAELIRFRRGDLDAATVMRLMERTRGLVAPEAPPEGDLVPNGTGWVVGTGTTTHRLFPRLWPWSLRSGGFIALGPFWTQLLDLPRNFALSMLVGAVPIAFLIGTVGLMGRLRLRRLKAGQVPFLLADTPAGTPVCVTGVISEQPTVPTLFRGIPAVLFKSRVGEAQQTQGIDFQLQLDHGQGMVIAVRNAVLLDRARRSREPPACGPVSCESWTSRPPRLTSDLLLGPSLGSKVFGAARRYEASVGPGDRVEVCGLLHHELAPDQRASFSRQLPTRFILRGRRDAPLLVRSVRADR